MGREDYSLTKLECNNAEVVKAYCDLAGISHDEGATKAKAYKQYSVPFYEIKELSKQYPEELICCLFELPYYVAEIDMEFKGGVEHLIDYHPSYRIESRTMSNKDIEEKAHNKVIEFFKKLDKPEIHDLDGLYMAWSDDDVTYRVELESDDPLKRYRVEASREGQNYINMKVFKGNAVFEWVDLEESSDGEDSDLPF